MWKFWRGRKATKVIDDYGNFQIEHVIRNDGVIGRKAEQMTWNTFRETRYLEIPSYGSYAMPSIPMKSSSMPSKQIPNLWKCIYCKSPNEVNRHHCLQCGAPLEV